MFELDLVSRILDTDRRCAHGGDRFQSIQELSAGLSDHTASTPESEPAIVVHRRRRTTLIKAMIAIPVITGNSATSTVNTGERTTG